MRKAKREIHTSTEWNQQYTKVQGAMNRWIQTILTFLSRFGWEIQFTKQCQLQALSNFLYDATI